ncbi:MAG: hypothetical protein IJ089_00695 [Clostridia bacterium]|nr:hypothetical protein [Clostridia bacterium]
MKASYQAFMRDIRPSKEFCITLEGKMNRALYTSEHQRNPRYAFMAVTAAIMMIVALCVIITRPITEDNVMQSMPITAESSMEEGNDGATLLPDETTKPSPEETNAPHNTSEGSIWIDTSAEALSEAEDSVAVQMVKADFSADRIYGGVDAAIHFSANGKDYVLYHALDNYSGFFVLSTLGIEPYPYNTFGGEDNAEAAEYFEAANAAREAYFAFIQSAIPPDDS